MLEFDDIQHILLTRVPALTGRYEFLSRADHKRETDGAGGQEETPDQAGDEDGVDERKGFGPGLLVALDPGREPDEIPVSEEAPDQQEQAEGHGPEHGPPMHRHEAANAATRGEGQDHDRQGLGPHEPVQGFAAEPFGEGRPSGHDHAYDKDDDHDRSEPDRDGPDGVCRTSGSSQSGFRRLVVGFACRAPEGVLADGAPALECSRVAVVLRRLHQGAQDDGAVGLTQTGFDDEPAKFDFLAGVAAAFGVSVHARPELEPIEPLRQAKSVLGCPSVTASSLIGSTAPAQYAGCTNLPPRGQSPREGDKPHHGFGELMVASRSLRRRFVCSLELCIECRLAGLCLGRSNIKVVKHLF